MSCNTYICPYIHTYIQWICGNVYPFSLRIYKEHAAFHIGFKVKSYYHISFGRRKASHFEQVFILLKELALVGKCNACRNLQVLCQFFESSHILCKILSALAYKHCRFFRVYKNIRDFFRNLWLHAGPSVHHIVYRIDDILFFNPINLQYIKRKFKVGRTRLHTAAASYCSCNIFRNSLCIRAFLCKFCSLLKY